MRNILFVLALLTLAACTEERSSEQHLARAKEFIAASNYPSAITELRNALVLDGAMAEARWLLAKTHLDAGEILEAEKELQRARDLGWPADDLRPAIAETLLAQGKFLEVLALEPEVLNPSAAALLLSHQALAALADKQADKARELVARALNEDPRLLEAKLAEATITVYLGDPADALNQIDKILAQAPDAGEAWWLKGQALVQQGKSEDARTAFDQSIAHATVGIAERITRALVNIRLEDYTAAQSDATELLKRAPQYPAANYIQGLLDVHNKQYRNAITTLTKAEPVTPQFPLVPYYLSMSYLIENDLVLAEKFGRQFVATVPDDASGRKLLSAILVRQNKAGDAREVLEPVLDQNPDDIQALNIMANALLLDDRVEMGMQLYARIAQLQPDWRYIPLRMEAELVTPDSGDEASQLAAAPDNAANFPQTDILLILDHLTKKNFQGAIEAAKSYQFRDLDSPAPYNVLAGIFFAAGQPAEAKDAFGKALKREPGDHYANLGLAEMALHAGDQETARRHYQTVLEYHPDDLAALLQLSALEAGQNNTTAMVATLGQAIQAHPSALEPRLRLAAYYMSSGSPEKVEPLFAKLTALQRRSPRVLEFTALAQLAQKQNDGALATLRQLVAVDPASAQAHYLLALAASATGDKQQTKQALREAIQRDPKHAPSLLQLASIAVSEGEHGLFEQYLATLIELAPEAPEVLRLRAQAAHANGNGAEALVFSQRAFKVAPASQTVLELATYQKAAGKNEAARNTLTQWVENHQADVTVRLTLANDLALGNDLPGAKAQYLTVLAVEPNNIPALNNLAWHLRLENPKEALAYIRRAASIAPDLPEVLDTLAVIESLNGDHSSAEQHIQRALAANPDNISMRFHAAMIAAALGDNARAVATLEELMTKDFPERAEAEALLKSLRG